MVGGGPPGPAGPQHDEQMRPESMGTDHSYEFAGGPSPPIAAGGARPASHGMAATLHQQPQSQQQPHQSPMPTMPVAGLSRTDQIVLRHFWEEKIQLNKFRDLHFLKVPHFSEQPSHNELVPFCEIYHLVRSTPRAAIIGLGSANGVYIG